MRLPAPFRSAFVFLVAALLAPLALPAHETWDNRTATLSGSSSLTGIAYNGSRFLLSTSTATYWRSAAGTSNWTLGSLPTPPTSYSSQGIATGAGATVISGVKNTLYTTSVADPAPADWTRLTPITRPNASTPDLYRIRFLNNLFLVGSQAYSDATDFNANSYSELLTSPDGATWTSRKFPASTLSNANFNLRDVAFKPGTTPGTGTYVFVTASTTVLLVPESFASATRVTVTNLGTGQSIAHGAGVFVITTNNGRIFSSPTGAAGTWTERSLPVATGSFGEVFHDGARFVAVGANVTGSNPTRPAILHSTDGTTWNEAATVPNTSNLPLAVVHRADGLWLAGGSTRTLLTSGNSSVSAPSFPVPPPSTAQATVGGTLTLTATASGTPAPTLQWFRGNNPLADAGPISGTTTSTLVITGVTFADAGTYTLAATNSVGTTNSTAATVSVSASAGGATLTPYGVDNSGGGSLLPGASPAASVFGVRTFTAGTGVGFLPNTFVNLTSYFELGGLSPDGSLAVFNASGSARPLVYTLATQSGVLLPEVPLPLGPVTSITFFSATGIANNGDVTGILQTSLDTFPFSQNHAFRYSAATQTYTLLGRVPNPGNDIASNPAAISADGATIAGYERTNPFDGPFLWNTTTGFTLLPAPTNGGTPNGDVRALSPGARYIAGLGSAPASLGSGQTALRWDRGASLGAPVGTALMKRVGDTFADARTVNDDGTVGGTVRQGSGFANERAALWFPDGALLVLPDHLQSTYGFDFTGFTLQQVTSVSADRRILAGTGLNSSGLSEGWLLTLPAPLASPAGPRLAARPLTTFGSLTTGTTLAFTSRDVGTSSNNSVSLQNLGSAPLTLTAAPRSGTHAADFTLNTTLPLTLQPGESVNLSLRFTPSAAGARTATLAFATNDPAADSLAFTLSATGTGVALTAQTITFPTPFDRPANSSSFQLEATSTSGLAVTYTLVSGPATLSGDRVTFTGEVGAITLRATQPGNTTFAAATPVEVTFQATTPAFGTIPQIIAFSLPATTPFGTAPITLNGQASSSLPLTYAITQGADFATLSGGVLTLTGAGTVTVRASQAGDPSFAPSTRDATVIVTKAAQTITFPPLTPATIALGAPVPTLAATATSGLPVEYTIVSGPASLGEEGSVLRPSAPGTIRIRADQFGDDNHQSARPVERTLTVTGPALTLGNLRQTYTATPREVTVTGVPEGFEDSLVVTYSARTYPVSETPPTDAGTYTVTATLGTVRRTGSLIIAKAPLTVRAEEATRPVATANPSFTLTYEGFLGDDTQSDLDRLPLPTTKATIKSPAGSYPITFTGGLDNNYAYVPAEEPGQLVVLGFGGTYEALLVDADLVPAGKLVLTVPANAFSYSGTLTTAPEGRTVSFRSTPTKLLSPSPDVSSATLGDLLVTVSGTAYNLDLALNNEGTLSGTLTRDDAPFATLAPGARLYVPAPRSAAPWIGAHTLVLNPASNLLADGPLPAGSGHATADINASGTLRITGKLADGTTLTATLNPDDTGTYRLYLNPYGTRVDSFLAGPLALQAHPDSDRYNIPRYYIPADAGLLTWQKAASPAKPLDKSYRTGFGPLGVPVTLDPWIAPSAPVPARGANPARPAVSLPQLLGLTESNTAAASLVLAYLPEDLDLGESASTLPATLDLSAATAAKLTVPLPNPRAFRLTTFNPKTGAFAGSFSLSDPSPTSTRPILRPVTFSGILRQPPTGETDPVLGAGHFLLPDLLNKTAEQPSAALQLTAP